MAKNIKTFKNYSNNTLVQSNIKDMLNEVNDKLGNIEKTIGFLDVIKITDAVWNKEDCAAQINNLLKNTALVINTKTSFILGNNNYAPGDIVLRTDKDELIIIPAISGGLFFPAQVTEDSNNNITMTYKYQSISPRDETKEIIVNDPTILEEASKNIKIKNLKPTETENTNIYGWYGRFNESAQQIEVKHEKFNDKESPIITPFVKFFWLIDNEPEEVVIKYKYKIIELNGVEYFDFKIDGYPIENESLLYLMVK